jgi:hypothetical protein
MSIDPMAALLQDNNDRISAAERLSHAHAALLDSIEDYRSAWKDAREAGWAITDLERKAGLINPAKLPRPKRVTPAEANSTRVSSDPLN